MSALVIFGKYEKIGAFRVSAQVLLDRYAFSVSNCFRVYVCACVKKID